MCCDQLAHRIFEICDTDKLRALSFTQLCNGLTLFQPNISAKIDSAAFVDTCTRFMDTEHCGIITKLAVLTLCNVAFERQQSYLLADALWEVWTVAQIQC